MNSRQFALELLAPRAPSLGNFVAGPNGAALEALRSARDAAAGAAQFLHLWGPPGSGRSHLLQALCPGQEGVPAFEPGRRLYCADDVHLLDAGAQARLFALQNEIRAHEGTVLVTAADAPPAALALREDVRSRLGWGLVFHLRPIPEEDEARALLEHARSRGARVDEELVPWMLTRLPRDMRTLVSVIEALDAYALERRRALTVPLLREWLQQGHVE